MKVAQIARRLAEKLAAQQKDEAAALMGPDPEIAETAAIAHDLGHPPFGHIAEDELSNLAKENGDDDWFNGNAQSFRIVTRLAVRTDKYLGLNLTAATLNGILKYPWFRQTTGHHRWGAYHAEETTFRWAREELGLFGNQRSVEAELMDWADDIAYSVFDVDDFYRAGLVPLDRLVADKDERTRFVEGAEKRLIAWGKDPHIMEAFKEVVLSFPPVSLRGPFVGSREQRALLRSWTSELIKRYVFGISLRVPSSATDACVKIEPQLKDEVESLKQIVWHYVIENPRLVTQQYGERKVIQGLFSRLHESTLDKSHKFDIFPAVYRGFLQDASSRGTLDQERTRITIDMISGMTENQAIRLFHRISGISLGSIHDQL